MFPVQFASAIIAIFTAIVGYYVTTVVEEIRSGTAIIYDARRVNDTVNGSTEVVAVLDVKNVSRSATVKNLYIGIKCLENKPACFQGAGPAAIKQEVLFAPIAGKVTYKMVTPVVAEIRVSLVPGAKVSMRYFANPNNTSDMIFIYYPDSVAGDVSQSEPTLVQAIKTALNPPASPSRTPVFLEQGGITALLVEYYFVVMAWAMSAAILLLGATTVFWAIHSLGAGRKKPTETEDVQKISVDLVLRTSDPSL
ncbi:hypothetical protein [Puniceibacterium sp. IMCC21224]|uniref:hypothetical protein n=1 Tax=Puniceibacterium sp. IMCC21224 TaxID=1618204 RepID=UPI00064D7526|nr:hypothetical protein [Puniceibacterium sp. IMCC21224]KMK67327.1 hypothetical protein IMCC21224_112195 [Puniceibacterium sp. IMCC21224]